jgi:hypothetical protein
MRQEIPLPRRCNQTSAVCTCDPYEPGKITSMLPCSFMNLGFFLVSFARNYLVKKKYDKRVVEEKRRRFFLGIALRTENYSCLLEESKQLILYLVWNFHRSSSHTALDIVAWDSLALGNFFGLYQRNP